MCFPGVDSDDDDELLDDFDDPVSVGVVAVESIGLLAVVVSVPSEDAALCVSLSALALASSA